MAKSFTPIIGLAVVMALALAAVFGSMSLANPAMAAIGQPADAELTERTVSPQMAISVKATGQDQSIAVEWTDPTDSDTDAFDDVDWEFRTKLTRNAGWGDWTAIVEGSNAGELQFMTDSDGDDTTTLMATVGASLSNGRTYDVQINGVAPGTDQVLFDSGTVMVVPNTIPTGTITLTAKAVEGGVELTYMLPAGTGFVVTGWEYQMRDSCEELNEAGDACASPLGADAGWPTDSDNDQVWSTIPGGATSSPHMVDVSANLVPGTRYDFRVRPLAGVHAHETPVNTVALSAIGLNPIAAPEAPFKAEIILGSHNPGSNTSYTITIKFNSPANGFVPGVDDIVIQLTEDDWQVPSSINESTVTVSSEGNVANPASVNVDDQEITLVLQDMNGDVDGVTPIGGNKNVTVIFRATAGISNPTEGGDYGDMSVGDGTDAGTEDLDEVNIRRTISIDPEDGGIGEVVTATGKGFKNGTTLTVFLDMDQDGILDANEDALCAVGSIGGDDVGKCEFTVTHPTFSTGAVNYVNAVDGLNNAAVEAKPFELKESISASPSSGSPGEIMLIQVVDFTASSSITSVTIGGIEWCNNAHGGGPCGWVVDSNGSRSFNITVPNWARAGTQRLEVKGSQNGDKANTNVTISGPQITATPESVLANQRISLVGVGFSSNAMIGRENDANGQQSKVSVGGQDIGAPGASFGWGRLNGGDPVEIDTGGNWSASLDLPLTAATTAAGERVVRITDSENRTGVIIVSVPERTVSITPEAGRVGTIAVIRGTGFPSKNDEGSSFNVQIVYDAGNDKETTVSAVPDASGRFEVQLRVPTTASIPSTNTVRVSFEDDDNMDVVTNVAHEVPEGIITLSATSGGPGSTVTVDGEGFKSFVPIALVRVGSLDVTPSPKPSTDGNGMMSFDVTIPGLDVGIQTIEVNVGQTTASTGFTVTESGVNPGDIRPVAEGLAELGDNLDVIWHFNNDSKTWTFYDGQEGSTLTHVITGETYLILVKGSVEVILNRDTRSLTCVGGNCWNQIVW